MVVKDAIVKYLKSPDGKTFTFENFSERLSAFMRAFGLCLLIIFTLSILTAGVRVFGRIEFRPNDIPLAYFWAINILVVPLLEETAFRLPLIYSRGNLSLSVLVVSYLIISYSTGASPLEAKGIAFRFCISGALAGILYLTLRSNSIAKKITSFWENNRKIIFYLLLVTFTIRHLDSYMLTSTALLLSPILLLPQLVSGVFLSFVRVRFGFAHSVLFHMMINIAAFMPQMVLHYVNR